MILRPFLPFAAAVLALLLGACGVLGEEDAQPGDASAAAAGADPMVARALADPLMSDPDLASRSEANALVTFTDSVPLPVFPATPEAATRARDLARAELLTSGAIPALGPVASGSGGAALGGLTDPAAILSAMDVPPGCRSGVRPGFAFAARLASPAAIMPQGMVELAAGSDAPGCGLRLVRYLTPASVEDVLIYHNTLAQRAGFAIQRFDQPEAILLARGKQAATLRVHARKLPGGMSAVDMAFWLKP